MLTAKNIEVRFGKKRLLRNVSLTIGQREFVAILGQNGAGKSTLLKTLYGEIKKYSGEIQLNGKSLKDFTSLEMAQVRAVLPQNSNLTFPFTVKEIVEMGSLPFRKFPNKKEVVAKALRVTKLEAYENRIFQTLSGGEKQRVHLARVLIQILGGDDSETKFLFLDEPTNNLDLIHQFEILSIVKSILNRNLSVVCVLHDINLASQFASRIIFMKEGKVTLDGTARELLKKEVIKKNIGVEIELFHNEKSQTPLFFPILNKNLENGENKKTKEIF